MVVVVVVVVIWTQYNQRPSRGFHGARQEHHVSVQKQE
jgi:hypothetical protein